MLNLLDESLEAFLRAAVPLPQSDVDVSFDAPDSDWGVGVTKPTINMFLWDIRRNVHEQDAGWTIAEEDGRMVRTRPLPRVDFRYIVTAWTSDVRDEHALLGAVLATLLQNGDLPEEHLQGAYATVRPIPTLDVGERPGLVEEPLGG